MTGEGSLQHFRKDHELEGVVASPRIPTASPAEALKAELEKKDSEIKRLNARTRSGAHEVGSSSAHMTDKIKEVKGVKVLAHRVDNLERAQLRTLVDQLRDKIGSGVVVLGSATNGNVSLIVGVTKDLTSRVQAGKVIGPVAQKVKTTKVVKSMVGVLIRTASGFMAVRPRYGGTKAIDTAGTRTGRTES